MEAELLEARLSKVESMRDDIAAAGDKAQEMRKLPDDIVDKLAECFYCSEGDRIDASHYECDDKGRWRRLANLDCD